MHLKQFSFILLSLMMTFTASAQYLDPVTRFYAEDNPYRSYSNEFLSGFVQSADGMAQNGFLQMPFVGDPLLIYVGEKDSTQYMAYASGYDFKQRADNTGRYFVDLTRYGIKAQLTALPAYTIHEYTYPDTLADKGFLVDLDYAVKGFMKEDMDVKLVDKYTLCASKHASADPQSPQLFYYAQFSHPFTTWNIRRERVKLENGQKEARCKVALTFSLKPNEKLVVASAVSKVSSDRALAQLEGHAPKRYKESNSSNSSRIIYRFDKSTSTARYTPKKKSLVNQQLVATNQTEKESTAVDVPVEFVELVTREADLKAAFFSAMSLLKVQPECRNLKSVDEFFAVIAPIYFRSAEPQADERRTDTLLRKYAQDLFKGDKLRQNQVSQAAWYVFNALGLRPIAGENKYELVRPLFNVATLYLSNGRRLMMHMKNNSSANVFVERVEVMHKPLIGKPVFTYEQLMRGGMVEVKMTCNP